jgi:hypothetical protein
LKELSQNKRQIKKEEITEVYLSETAIVLPEAAKEKTERFALFIQNKIDS